MSAENDSGFSTPALLTKVPHRSRHLLPGASFLRCCYVARTQKKKPATDDRLVNPLVINFGPYMMENINNCQVRQRVLVNIRVCARVWISQSEEGGRLSCLSVKVCTHTRFLMFLGLMAVYTARPVLVR